MPQIRFLREHKDAFHGKGAVIHTYKEGQEVEASDEWLRNLRTHDDHRRIFELVKEEVAPPAASDIEALTTEQISAMNRNDILALGVEGLSAMTVDQVSAIAEKARTGLKKDQAKVIEEKLSTK